MEQVDIECIIAAILTVGSLGQSGKSALSTVNLYTEVLHALRATGNYRVPETVGCPSYVPYEA